jgi:hypothetical protein
LLWLLLQGAPQVKYGSLSTTELKEVCKERGLSTKGQVRLRGRAYTCLLRGAQREGVTRGRDGSGGDEVGAHPHECHLVEYAIALVVPPQPKMCHRACC